VVQEVTNVHQTRGMNMMKVNQTHVHAVYEKIKVLHYYRFAAKGLFFRIISISHMLGKLQYVSIWYRFYSCNKFF